MNEKIAQFLSDRQPETPCLVVDLDLVAGNYRTLRRALPLGEIFYAVKANPAPQILRLLLDLGSNFDAASIHEVERCLEVARRSMARRNVTLSPEEQAYFRQLPAIAETCESL